MRCGTCSEVSHTSPGPSPARRGDPRAIPAVLPIDRPTRGLHGSVRDARSVTTSKGDGSGLTSLAFVEAGTHWPRNHVVVRDTILVAGQRASEVVSLLVDERTGIPGRVRHRTAAPTPTCLLPTR